MSIADPRVAQINVSSVEGQGVQLELTEDELVTTEEGKELYGLELARCG